MSMIKNAILVIFAALSIFSIQSQEVPSQIIEAQQSEKMLVDLLYDHKDYAIELWNQIVSKPDNREEKINKALTALNYSLEVGDILFQLQDKLIEYYSKQNYHKENLRTSRNNRKISEGIIKDINKLKNEFIDLKTRI